MDKMGELILGVLVCGLLVWASVGIIGPAPKAGSSHSNAAYSFEMLRMASQ